VLGGEHRAGGATHTFICQVFVEIGPLIIDRSRKIVCCRLTVKTAFIVQAASPIRHTPIRVGNRARVVSLPVEEDKLGHVGLTCRILHRAWRSAGGASCW